jgi:hypothetical protein
MSNLKPATCVLLIAALTPPILPQEPAPTSGDTPKYEITVLDDASKFRRVRKGTASSQASIKLTDQNNTPVAGIAVTFTIPQLTGGATFANGALTAVTTTNAAGIASSTVSVASTASAFNVGVAAAVPGQAALTATIPVNTAAAAAAAGGSAGVAGGASSAGGGAAASHGLLIAVIAAAAGAVAGGTYLANRNDRPKVSISGSGPATVGPPR